MKIKQSTGCGAKIGKFNCCSIVYGDFLELEKYLPKSSIDLIVTDPPYGINWTKKPINRWTRKMFEILWDKQYHTISELTEHCTDERYTPKKTLQRLYAHCKRLKFTINEKDSKLKLKFDSKEKTFISHYKKFLVGCKNDNSSKTWKTGIKLAIPKLKSRRHIYCFGKHKIPDDMPIGGKAELIWNKEKISQGSPINSRWKKQHEYIQFGVYHPSRKKAPGDGRLVARLRHGSVLTYKPPSTKNHPFAKPISLLRELIESSSRLGEIVLDPFAGSGTTLEAAMLEGRHFIGFEIDKEYYKSTRERIKVVQSRLLELKLL